MATVETCRVIYLRQSIKIAAFESARISVLPDATYETVKIQTDCVLLGRSIKNYAVYCVPEVPSTARSGDLITIRITAPISENSVLSSWIYRDRVVDESVRIMKD
ncbi:MAG: pilus assembly protein [Pirellula sp.]|nr:pilus assembly protein [Pirellula sp.]